MPDTQLHLSLCRRNSSHIVQPLANFAMRHACCLPLKDHFHIRSNRFIHLISVCSGLRFHIPIRRKCRKILSLLLSCSEAGNDLSGNIFCIHIVNHILQRYHQCIFRITGSQAVIAVRDGNKPNAKERKYLFQIFTCLDIVTPKSRQIFHQNALHLSSTYIVHQSFELRPVKVGTLLAVILIYVIELQIRMLFHIFFADAYLIIYRIPVVIFTTIFNRQPHIDSGHGIRGCHDRCIYLLIDVFSAFSCH